MSAIKVKDQYDLRDKHYGYCICGREVNSSDDPKKCPLCKRYLDWGEGHEGKRVLGVQSE